MGLLLGLLLAWGWPWRAAAVVATATGWPASAARQRPPPMPVAAKGYDLPQALVFTRCMRQHGYDMPDPQIEGNTVGLQLPNYQGQCAPKFQAAWQACHRYAPNAGRARSPSAEDRQQALAFARCMRQHGIDLPDPKPDGGIHVDGAKGPGPDDPRFLAASRPASSTCPRAAVGGSTAVPRVLQVADQHSGDVHPAAVAIRRFQGGYGDGSRQVTPGRYPRTEHRTGAAHTSRPTGRTAMSRPATSRTPTMLPTRYGGCSQP
jgi:hypothetical protein